MPYQPEVWNLPLYNIADERQKISDVRTSEVKEQLSRLELAGESIDYISQLPPNAQLPAYQNFQKYMKQRGVNPSYLPDVSPEELSPFLQNMKNVSLKGLQRLQAQAKLEETQATTADTKEQTRLREKAIGVKEHSPSELAWIKAGGGPEGERAGLALKAVPQEADTQLRNAETVRHNKEMESIDREKINTKPDTPNQDKQKRIDIERRKNLGEQINSQDEAWAKAYDKVGSENIVAGAQARGEAYGDIRIQNYYDNQLGKEVTMSATDFNKKQKEEPGRYNLTTPSATDKNVQKVAYVNDIKNRMTSVWSDLDAMPEWSEGQRAALVLAAKERDPSSAISQFMGGEWGKTLTDEQTNYLIHVRQLNENALGMRNLTQGSPAIERVVDAIEKTVPNMLTPNKKFAYKQLNALNEQLQDLEKGFAKINVPGTSGATGPATQPATTSRAW